MITHQWSCMIECKTSQFKKALWINSACTMCFKKSTKITLISSVYLLCGTYREWLCISVLTVPRIDAHLQSPSFGLFLTCRRKIKIKIKNVCILNLGHMDTNIPPAAVLCCSWIVSGKGSNGCRQHMHQVSRRSQPTPHAVSMNPPSWTHSMSPHTQRYLQGF